MSERVLEVTDGTFGDAVLKGKGPVLVDFWADWCSPCKLLSPVIDDLADTYKGKLSVFKIDVDGNPETVKANNIRAFPTLILFVNGEEKGRLTGMMPKSRYADLIEPYLGE